MVENRRSARPAANHSCAARDSGALPDNGSLAGAAPVGRTTGPDALALRRAPHATPTPLQTPRSKTLSHILWLSGYLHMEAQSLNSTVVLARLCHRQRRR